MRELKYLVLFIILACFGCTGTFHLTDPIHATILYDAYPRSYHTTTYVYPGYGYHYYPQNKWNYHHQYYKPYNNLHHHQHDNSSYKKENNTYYGHRRK